MGGHRPPRCCGARPYEGEARRSACILLARKVDSWPEEKKALYFAQLDEIEDDDFCCANPRPPDRGAGTADSTANIIS